MSKTFDGKVALVTGATGGIGRAAAIAFAEQGAKVVLTGRREEEGRKSVDMITDKGGDACFVRADASSEEDCSKMVETALSKFSRLDAAFNNAGIEGVGAMIAEQTTENFHNVMNINVLGVMNSMKYQIQAMLKGGGGAIVNNASVAGMIGMPHMGVYVASKHAVVGLTKVAALEYGTQGIRVNAVSPAAIETDMYQRFTGGDAETMKQFAKMHPIGRVGKSEEVAHAVTYLCAPGAGFVTGINLPVDGAFTAQ